MKLLSRQKAPPPSLFLSGDGETSRSLHFQPSPIPAPDPQPQVSWHAVNRGRLAREREGLIRCLPIPSVQIETEETGRKDTCHDTGCNTLTSFTESGEGERAACGVKSRQGNGPSNGKMPPSRKVLI